MRTKTPFLTSFTTLLSLLSTAANNTMVQACKCGDAEHYEETQYCCKRASGNLTADNDCDYKTLEKRSLFASCCWQGFRQQSDCSCSPGCIGDFEVNPARIARGLEPLSQEEIRGILETYV
ncbi:hypothetical protein V8F20_002952 [Naviculisporaceae sp. PSN 640]